jgi:membrane protease YdiL (CAAX protease family)
MIREMHEIKKPAEDVSEVDPALAPVKPEDPAEGELNSSHAPPFRPQRFDDRMSRIFLGPDGLRPIWQLFLYLAMSRVLYLLLSAVLSYAQRFDLLQLWIDMASELVLLLAAVIPAFVMARLEGRSFDDYGLPRHCAFGKLFWIGAMWGIAALSGLMLAMHGFGAVTFTSLALHGLRILKFAAFWGVFFLSVAFAEEFLLRGYSQFTLARATGFWPAAVLLSIAFGAIHLLNPGEFAVGFHAAWDWGESYLYSVPDSGGVSPGHLLKCVFHGPRWLTGGSVGPEGSVLIFVVLVLLWALFERVYPEVKYNSNPSMKIVAA